MARKRRRRLTHDEVVDARAREIGVDFVITNQGGEKNFPVNGLYPDIVVFEDEESVCDEDSIDWIEEVEFDTVSDREADQWEDYYHLGYPLVLVVPEDDEEEAIELSCEHELECKIVTYDVDEDGDIVFSD